MKGPGSRGALKGSGSSGMVGEDVQHTLNEWMDKVEQQVNTIEENLYLRANKSDLTRVEAKLKKLEEESINEIASTKAIANGAEQLATRMVDDVMAG